MLNIKNKYSHVIVVGIDGAGTFIKTANEEKNVTFGAIGKNINHTQIERNSQNI